MEYFMSCALDRLAQTLQRSNAMSSALELRTLTGAGLGHPELCA